MNPDSLPRLLQVLIEGGPISIAMAVSSLFVVALGVERLLEVQRFKGALRRADEQVVEAARRGDFETARRQCESVRAPVREVFSAGLDRGLGRVRGDARSAMQREHRKAIGHLRALVWLLGTAGAMMPFVGLFGTVLGVMSSFAQIGSTGQGGFAVVSAGISEALITTAIGLFVALEAVLLYNVLQNAAAGCHQRLGLLVDELLELLELEEARRAGSPTH